MPDSDAPLKRIVRYVLPDRLYAIGKRSFLTRQARLLRDKCTRVSAIDGKVRHVLSSPYFRPEQKTGEIVNLLELLRSRTPRYLCEVGGKIGGSLALFAQIAATDAEMLSIDIDYKTGQREALAAFATGDQKITCLAADSHAQETLAQVRNWLAGRQLDFLFIDGDHSLAGVTRDHQMYAPLVRRGGIIAFHDIVMDSRTRSGVQTASDAGEVPAFWRRLKGKGFTTEEYIERQDQDGFGIGVLHWEGQVDAL